ncbi:MAG TPA: 5-formyltetrahydrofolate cyclo-ligase [Verrucomicrobiae bacterium]
MTIQEEKAALRQRMFGQLKKITPELQMLHSANACLILENEEIWKNARSVLFFAPLPEEPDIWPLAADALAAKKKVALPKFIPERNHYASCEIQNFSSDVEMGKFGIREPKASCAEIPPIEFDLILVPGIAFDLHGNRLGRGQGFYDRLLAEFRGTKIGIAFDEQISTEVSAEAHDVRMDFILTPTRCLQARD